MAPAEITLATEVTKGSSDVLWVEFFANGQMIGRATTAPFGLVWQSVPAGTYSLQAIATDALRNNAASAPVTITVAAPPNQPPAVSIISPANGAAFMAPTDIEIQVNAADADGTIAQVEVFAGDTSLGLARLLLTLDPAFAPTIPVYLLVWSNAPVGQYVLTAKATDNEGALTTSAPVSIQVTETPSRPIINLSVPDRAAAEGTDDNALFVVSRQWGDLQVPLTVNYSVSGTATPGEDYVALPGFVVIPAGELSAAIVVHALADTVADHGERVMVTITLSLIHI